ncbi:MAG: sigma-70 family RNA polymerase sigma factor [Ruminococcaceae bacterium]|nr:sigma-70 family RNA polymerase sigma factor [Oscillospiraceae bacterium]
MTNEELAMKIQKGEAELMPQLWEQIKRWVYKMAHKWVFRFDGARGVTVDDLISSGYIAFAEAVKTFQPVSAFTTWLTMYLKKAFLDTYGLRAHKDDPLHDAVSLDAPLQIDDDLTLGESVADPYGEAELLAQEEKLFQVQLHEALEETLSTLPEDQSEVLRLHYYDSLSFAEIAQCVGVYPQTVKQRESKALRTIRRSPKAQQLTSFIDFDCYHGVGSGTFRRTGMSIQERYLMNLEYACERKMHKQVMTNYMDSLD